MDVMYLGILALAFAGTYGLLLVCERLSHDTEGERR
jgi:hypothetical protein